MVQQIVMCGACGVTLCEAGSVPVEQRTPCGCGSTSRTFALHVAGEVWMTAHLVLHHRRPGMRKAVAEIISGWELHKRFGDMVEKYRHIDRRNDRYIERIATRDGELIRDVDERLSEHIGHGSAKTRGQ